MVIDLEKYENMPFREGKGYIQYYWNKRRFKYPWNRSDSNDNPYIIVRRVLKKYLNKSFSEAFSYYCKLVPTYDQHYFLNEFNRGLATNGYNRDSYYIDVYGNIKEYIIEQPKKIVSINRIPNIYLEKVRKSKSKIYTWLLSNKTKWVKSELYPDRYNNSYPQGEQYNKENFILIKDNAEYFDSKQNYRFKRYFGELEKSKKSTFKNEREQQRKAVELGLLSKFSISKSAKKVLKKKMEAERKEKERLAKEEMKLTLQRKGFRPNAFINKPD